MFSLMLCNQQSLKTRSYLKAHVSGRSGSVLAGGVKGALFWLQTEKDRERTEKRQSNFMAQERDLGECGKLQS